MKGVVCLPPHVRAFSDGQDEAWESSGPFRSQKAGGLRTNAHWTIPSLPVVRPNAGAPDWRECKPVAGAVAAEKVKATIAGEGQLTRLTWFVVAYAPLLHE